ncbi:MAG: SUMF1/EgtB/PvdO family nonheme iron enzyme [Candidatus Thiodiazotropha sp.]
MEDLSHQVFISYRHESDEHAAAVRHLGEELQSASINVVLDQLYLEAHPGGPDEGWPKWCEQCVIQSSHILIIASTGWFTVYRDDESPGEGLGAASEADLFRQALWDQKGQNARIRLVYLDDIESDEVPVRLRAWEPFRLFNDLKKESKRLIKWIQTHRTDPFGNEPFQSNSLPPLASEEVIPKIPNPYPGLATFKPEQHSYFFGRDNDTARVVKKLNETRFVSLIGPSGTGKSSLVAAGLVPALRDQHPTLTYLSFKPRTNPFQQLAKALDQALPEDRLPFGPSRAKQITEALENAPAQAIEDYLGQLQSPVLLLGDQFEELYTQTPAGTAGRFRELLKLLHQRQDLNLVLTLRDEFMRRLKNWMGGKLFDSSLVSLDPIEGEEHLRAIIAGPAKDKGVPVEPRLISALIKATETTNGALPLIALALNKLFDQRDPRKGLTLDTYQRMGGLESVVENIATDIDRAIRTEPALERACTRLFSELATVIDDLPTRRTVEVGPLRADPDMGRLIEALRAQGFLSDPNPKQIELAHETLLSHWPRLLEWCDQYSNKLSLRRLAEQAAREWQRAKGQEAAEPNGNPHHSDALRWTWERQGPALEALLALNHLPPCTVPDYTNPGIHAWYELKQHLDEPLCSFLHPEPLRLLDELQSDETTHQRREEIGLRLNQMGDPRRGVGLDEHGLPEIEWVEVGVAGEVTLETDPPQSLWVDVIQIAKYPITWQQYRAFLKAEDGYRNPHWWDELDQEKQAGEELWGFANYPAVNASWYDAVAFCRWLSHRRSLTGDTRVRLPTEWEWQWAAQAGAEAREYPWPGDWDFRRSNTGESGIGRTVAVGLYPRGSSRHGILDMAGNVQEWCLNKYYDLEETVIDVSGDSRMLRGGAWLFSPEHARAASRIRLRPHLRMNFRGFRVVCASPITRSSLPH